MVEVYDQKESNYQAKFNKPSETSFLSETTVPSEEVGCNLVLGKNFPKKNLRAQEKRITFKLLGAI